MNQIFYYSIMYFDYIRPLNNEYDKIIYLQINNMNKEKKTHRQLPLVWESVWLTGKRT